jgi:soluble lytic murein transglycosylase-like protein
VNKKTNRTPRTRKRALRNDTKSLLRSRPVQVLLGGVVGLQVVALAAGVNVLHHGEGKSATAAPAPSLAASLTTVTVSRPVEKAIAVATAPKKEESKVASADAKAEELAEKYRKKGFKISSALARQIFAAAQEHEIDPEIAFGLVKTESGFKNSATSHVGATGLTQLMPATARWLEPGVTRSQLRDSRTNLRIGFRYLRDLIEKYDGDTDLALLAYNRGPGTVDRVLRRGGDPDNGYADMVRGLRSGHK